MNDRQKTKRHKGQCKHNESLTKQFIFVEYSPFQKNHLSFAGTRSQMNTTLYITKIDQEKGKIEQVCIWNHMTTGFIK